MSSSFQLEGESKDTTIRSDHIDESKLEHDIAFEGRNQYIMNETNMTRPSGKRNRGITTRHDTANLKHLRQEYEDKIAHLKNNYENNLLSIQSQYEGSLQNEDINRSHAPINPPNIAAILDKHKSIGDKYEIVINDSTHQEYIIHNNNEQFIELIDDIIPLTEYHITARRYIESKKRWSKYCASVSIVPDFTLVWSKLYRGHNAKLSNLSRDVYCKSKKGSCTIVADKSISSTNFRQVLFSFTCTMISLAQFSYCGFLRCKREWNTHREIWDDLMVKDGDAYCLGFCNGSNSIDRWVNGTKKGTSKWRKSLKLQNEYAA
eukprot:968293_1